MTKHIITFSGGKDSLATIIWAKKNINNFEVVFCDTGWEHEKTYQHILEVEAWLGFEIIRLRSCKYADLPDLTIKKGRFASTKARFCTEELKVKPMIDYILSLNCDVVVYQGIRADESNNRSKMRPQDEYFRYYFEPYKIDKNGVPVYYSYRKKEIVNYCDKYSVDVVRPIFLLSVEQVFENIYSAALKPNPLYFDGFTRVGCFPCVQCNKSEIKIISERYPETISKIRNLEELSGSTFFPPKYIPSRFCSKVVKTPNGVKHVPTIDDVIKYVKESENTLFDISKTACQSIYAICE